MSRTTFGSLAIVALMASIVAANAATAQYAPWHVAGVVIPAGTWMIGFVFVTRDLVQLAFGRSAAYLAMAAGLVVNAGASVHYGDLRWITAGSACAFAVSAVVDTETFTRYRHRLVARVLAAGVASGALDSLVFVVVALSPLTLGFVTWGDVPRVIAAQVIVKALVVTALSAGFYRRRVAPA